MTVSPNILIVQTAFIGDIALSVFFADDVCQMFPNCKITFISTPIGCELLQCFSFIDYSIAFRKRTIHKGFKGVKAIVSQVNTNEYDYIFALHRSYRTAILVHFINAKAKIGFTANALSFLLSKRVEYRKDLHEVDRNRMLLSAISDVNPVFVYRQLYKNNGCNANNSIVIAPGAAWATKRWLPDYFVEFCKMLANIGEKIILVGSKNEIELCNYIESRVKVPIYNLAGKTTIPALLGLISNSKLLISNDSAPTHFASLCNTPTITIYGATSSKFGFYPLADKSISLEGINISCHPCAIHGGSACQKKHFKCMQNITPTIVFNSAKNIIDSIDLKK